MYQELEIVMRGNKLSTSLDDFLADVKNLQPGQVAAVVSRGRYPGVKHKLDEARQRILSCLPIDVVESMSQWAVWMEGGRRILFIGLSLDEDDTQKLRGLDLTSAVVL